MYCLLQLRGLLKIILCYICYFKSFSLSDYTNCLFMYNEFDMCLCGCVPISLSNAKSCLSLFSHVISTFIYWCCYNLFTNSISLANDINDKGYVDLPLLDETGIDITDPIQVDVLYIQVC